MESCALPVVSLVHVLALLENRRLEPLLDESEVSIPGGLQDSTLLRDHLVGPVQFSAGIDVPQTVFIIVLILNSSLWLIPAGNSRSATVHEEPPQMRAPPPLMRDHPSWPVVELFMYNLVLGLCKISPNTGRSGEKDDVETC